MSYEVKHDAASSGSSAGKLREVMKPTLFETSYALGRIRLFDLTEVLGDEGWLKALRLNDYASRRPHRPEMLQQVLFAYTEAI